MKIEWAWRHSPLRGKVEIREVAFSSLRRNPLGDPSRRSIAVYLPPQYDNKDRKFPLILGLAGFLGTGLGFLNTDPLQPNLVEQADWLIGKGTPPFILAFPDAFTRYGGSQYLPSLRGISGWPPRNRLSLFRVVAPSCEGFVKIMRNI